MNAAIRRDNYISAAGTTRGELVRASVDAETDVQDPQDFENIVVRQEGDHLLPLGLGELAVLVGVEIAEEAGQGMVALAVGVGTRQDAAVGGDLLGREPAVVVRVVLFEQLRKLGQALGLGPSPDGIATKPS